MSDPLKPSITVLIKLGSIAVHAEELTGPDGHEYDQIAMKSLMDDPEIVAWIAAMDAAAFMPKKRSNR